MDKLVAIFNHAFAVSPTLTFFSCTTAIDPCSNHSFETTLYPSVISLTFTFLQAVTWLLQVHEFAKKICNPLTEFP